MKRFIVIMTLQLGFLSISWSQGIDSVYLDLLRKQFKNFDNKLKRNKNVFIDDKIVYLIIDSLGKRIEGTSFPTILSESKTYRYAVMVLAPVKDSLKYTYKINGERYDPNNAFTILNTGETEANKGLIEPLDTSEIGILKSEVSDVFSKEVFFEVKKDTTTIFDWKIKLTGSKNYHVAIMGGYFHTTLNNPVNIIKTPLSGTDSTLIGDFTEGQRKISVMAVFYPWQRSCDYQWKRLKWYEYTSFGFGIGLDEDLFDDLFMGLNIEFAKGGYFSAGVHCGKHNVLVNNSDFDYGTDVWELPFDNSLIKEEWGLGFYAGVTIDLRVISEMIGTRDRLNEKDEN